MKKMKSGVSGIVVPMFIESNGKMEKVLEVARNPKVQKEYKEMLKELKANPKDFSRKLREFVWKDKTVDEIHSELYSHKSK
jgi:hypothetical protein